MKRVTEVSVPICVSGSARVRNYVRNWVSGRVNNRAWACARARMQDSVRDRVWHRVEDRVYRRVENRVWYRVEDRARFPYPINRVRG